MDWTERTSKIQVGDQVRLTAEHLRSTGQVVGDAGFAKGIVKEIIGSGPTIRAAVDWDTPDMAGRVLLKYLEKVPQRGRG